MYRFGAWKAAMFCRENEIHRRSAFREEHASVYGSVCGRNSSWMLKAERVAQCRKRTLCSWKKRISFPYETILLPCLGSFPPCRRHKLCINNKRSSWSATGPKKEAPSLHSSFCFRQTRRSVNKGVSARRTQTHENYVYKSVDNLSVLEIVLL